MYIISMGLNMYDIYIKDVYMLVYVLLQVINIYISLIYYGINNVEF